MLVGLGCYSADKTKIYVVIVRFVDCWYFVAVDWMSMAQHGVDAALLGKWLFLSVINETFQTCAQARTLYAKDIDPKGRLRRRLWRENSSRNISPTNLLTLSITYVFYDYRCILTYCEMYYLHLEHLKQLEWCSNYQFMYFAGHKITHTTIYLFIFTTKKPNHTDDYVFNFFRLYRCKNILLSRMNLHYLTLKYNRRIVFFKSIICSICLSMKNNSIEFKTPWHWK